MAASDLLSPITSALGAMTLPGADDWMQGRTMYGGASALIAYTAAVRKFPDLPPIRAAQIGFVAPYGGDVELSATIVRQGRNVAQVRSEIMSEGRLALTAFWLFGTSRDSNADHSPAPVEEWPGEPEDAEAINTDRAPSFLRNNFEWRRAQDVSGRGPPVVRRWNRLLDPGTLDPISQLILAGDILPPGAMRAMQRQGPISSINWSFNLLDINPASRGGWWLSENASQFAGEGYSSERLRMWDTDGRQVIDGMQSVAIFG